MANSPEPFEVFALKYAEKLDRAPHECFLMADPHDANRDMDYFIWVIRGNGRLIVLDTGMDHGTASARGRQLTRPVAECLSAIGVEAATVPEVVVSHLHFDHAGGLDLFPKARLHLQDREMAFATGRQMCHAHARHPFELDHVTAMVGRVYAGDVVFHDGDSEIGPGLELYRLGGHSAGLMAMRVWTETGWLVLASDASHYYDNMQLGRPFPIVHSMAEVLEGYRRLYDLAGGDWTRVVPGHDPLVLQRFPAARDSQRGMIARLA